MKQSVITGSMGNLGDRFVPEGYKAESLFSEMAKKLSVIPGIRGLEISSDDVEGGAEQIREVAKILNDCNLECAAVNVPVSGKRLFGKGSLGATDDAVRQQAIDLCKRSADYAEQLNAEVINIWPGQDGFDYPLCTDYNRLYQTFLESLVSVADHNPSVKVSLEFKPREPRNRSLVDTYGTALLMCAESGRKNIGVTIDVGHVLYANANMAAAVEMCAGRGKLFHMHTNDCYGYWDDDMILGSVHFIEYIELCYALRKMDYKGWCSVDIFPSREDSCRCAEESIAYLELFDKMVDRIGMDKLEACREKGDASETTQLIRQLLLRI